MRFNIKGLTLDAVHLKYNDHPSSGTSLWGERMEWSSDDLFGSAFMKHLQIGFMYFHIYDSRNPARDGMNGYYAYTDSTPLPVLPDFGIKGTYVRETNDNSSGLSSAYAWYVTPYYKLSQVPWTPTFSYRYAFFSGGAGHAFDALFTGLPDWGYWFQGEVLGESVLSDSNLISHQVRMKLEPNDWLAVNLIYYRFLLDNRAQGFGLTPSTVTSHALADEVDLIFDVQDDELVVDHRHGRGGEPEQRLHRRPSADTRPGSTGTCTRTSTSELQRFPMPNRTPMPEALAAGFPVLLVVPPVDEELGRRTQRARDPAALEALGRPVVVSPTLDDAEAAVESHPALSCVVLAWGLAAASNESLEQTKRILARIRAQAAALPVLIGASKGATRQVPLEIVEQVEGYIWVPEDSATFIAGRIDAAAKRYLDTVLPPFFGQLVNFADTHEYSWHTPGHTGGTAFMKTAVGRAFLDFYGEQMLRSDLSVSVGSLGSLNDHSGPIAEAERYAARVFGADHTFFSVGGSSASNEIILHSAVADGDIVLVDRNCHKSLNYALNMSRRDPDLPAAAAQRAQRDRPRAVERDRARRRSRRRSPRARS